ncbi:MAG TPA: DNA-deoxyinosine glycosylase [Candidatus Pullichristensenella avicola]|nr:DNA-deoxyinosine glycosylase [Candidatus Pullichristensenella avicola]
MERIEGYAPVADANSRLLVLGTMPSVESLRAGFYYAHPRNAFWRILADVVGAPLPQTTAEKQALALENGVALWDVLRACTRRGSLDSAIRNAEANDFAAFFRDHARIERVLFNGAAAQRLFLRLCPGALAGRASARLPSTSPAYTLSYEQKRELWRKELLL